MLSLTLSSGVASADGNVNFSLAHRSVDDGFFDPSENHETASFDLDFGKDSWPVQVAIGIHYSVDIEKNVAQPPAGFGGDLPVQGDDPDLESGIDELSVGALWRPKSERSFKPYVGGGLAWVGAHKKATVGQLSLTDDDRSAGFYVNGGLVWRIGEHFNVGLGARLMTGTDIELFGEKGDADYFQVGLLMGYGW